MSGCHRHHLEAVDAAIVCTDALDPRRPETHPLAPSLFIPSSLMFTCSCGRLADAFQPQPLTSRHPLRRPPNSFPPMIPWSFNLVTTLSLNLFLTRNPSNITSVSPRLPDCLGLLPSPADVFLPSFFHPISPQPPQPLLLNPLIPPCSLPYPADIPHPCALSLGSFLSSPHPIWLALFHWPSSPGLLLSPRGLPPSSLASNSPPDTLPCLLTHNWLLDYLTKPAQFITMPDTLPYYRMYNWPHDHLPMLAWLITIHPVRSHPFLAHRPGPYTSIVCSFLTLLACVIQPDFITYIYAISNW